MSSPWKPADATSPAAQGLREEARHKPRSQNSHSPYRQRVETSSSMLWEEFSRLYVEENRAFREQLDEQVAEQERLHKEALALAAAEHERVRESAERARERVELEIERERRRREEEDDRALEAERKAKVERDAAERQRRRAEIEREEEEQKRRAAEEREIEAAKARLEEQKRKAEAEALQRKKDEDAAAAAAADVHAKEKAATAIAAPAAAPSGPTSTAPTPAASLAVPVSSANQPPSQPPPPKIAQNTPQHTAPSTAQVASVNPATNSSIVQREAQHQRYIDLHQRLKTMRKRIITECKDHRGMKKGQLGEWRRLVTKTVGQLTPEDPKSPTKAMIGILRNARQFSEPSVDVSSYMLSTPTDGAPLLMSGPLVYLLNILAKTIIVQFVTEASTSAAAAEPIGFMATAIFSLPDFKAGGELSLIDMLLAKYHVVCPVLWGIYGNEKTSQGRSRIGWWKSEGSWVAEQRHIERMTGLGVGYAAICLRDFSKAPNPHPYPPTNYWKSMSYIVNTPSAEAQTTHFIVLKAMVEGYVPKFVRFYGHAALVALRKALVEFPLQATKSPARDAVSIMPQTLQRDLRVTL